MILLSLSESFLSGRSIILTNTFGSLYNSLLNDVIILLFMSSLNFKSLIVLIIFFIYSIDKL